MLMPRRLDYRKIAEYYDMVESGPGELEERVEKALRHHKVKTVLDITAGTGKQSLYLAERGYKVIANDIEPSMLEVARSKMKSHRIRMRFNVGDMRSVRLGTFDAIISMYNSVGHLSKSGFAAALSNISRSLRAGGIYVFDIVAREFAEAGLPSHEFIGTAKTIGGTKLVVFIRYSYRSDELDVHQRLVVQEGSALQKTITNSWGMKVYYYKELEELLWRYGFKVLKEESVRGGADGRRSHFVVAMKS
jgi:SAM-dependent methyltransferase